MTRAHLQTVSVATLLLLAACPPASEGTTDSTAASETEGTTEATDSSAEETNSTPTNSTPATMGDTEPTGGTMSGTDSMGGTDSTTMADPTTGTVEPECTTKDQCTDPAAPFCEGEKCVSCSDTPMPDVACADLSGDAPVCSEGACVECTVDNAALCQGGTPVCGDDNACAGCTEHAQCGETACNLETGACFAPEYVLYVDRTAVCDGALGTMEAPFCKINDALAYVAVQPDVTVGFTVKIKGGNYVEDPLVVPDGATLVLTRWGDASPKIRAFADTSATLTVANGAKVFVDRLQLTTNDSKGIVCASATVWVDDSRLSNNQGQGFESTECTSYINRSVIYQNTNGGVASYDGATHIRNSFITANGSADLSDFGGVLSAQNNEMHIVYSTVAINLAAAGPRTLQCVGDGAVEVRNSVLIGYGTPSIDCVMGTFTSSAIDEGAVDGDGNYAATQADIMTFFEVPAAGVLAAKLGTAIENLAVWKDGDPKTDFNGTPRPNVDGEMDFAGADKP